VHGTKKKKIPILKEFVIKCDVEHKDKEDYKKRGDKDLVQGEDTTAATGLQ
jgi:hypothetical protein